MTIRKAARDRRRRDGRAASPRRSPMPACRCCCSTSCRTAPTTAARSPRRRSTRMAKAEPAPFMSSAAADAWSRPAISRTTSARSPRSTGSSRRWSSASTIKQRALRQARGACARPGSMVSSNTSTLPLAKLTEGLPETLRARLPDHPLLQPAALHAPARGGARARGPTRRGGRADRGVRRPRGSARAWSRCKDTPGFIANRIGCYWMQAAFSAAFEIGLPVEEADAVMGRPLGIPKTGVFGLADLVGHRPAAARRHEPARRAAAGRCRSTQVDREWPLIAEDDRDRLHRAQGQGRLLPPRTRQAASGSRRRSTSRPASTTPRAEAAARRARCRRRRGGAAGAAREPTSRRPASPGG